MDSTRPPAATERPLNSLFSSDENDEPPVPTGAETSRVGQEVSAHEAADANDAETDDESEWSDESMFEENLVEIDDRQYSSVSSPDCCSLEEARALRQMLRDVGVEQLVQRTYEIGTISMRKLCTAFGVSIGENLRDVPDEKFMALLGALTDKFLRKRRKLLHYNTADDAASLLKSSKNIIVITGAGISTNLGIPDFRSKGTGLYSRLAHLGLDEPQEAFSLELFDSQPEIFYSLAKDIYPSSKRFSPTHAFIRLLQDKGQLLTNFTQNIDNLEEAAGILDDKLIQCHGSWRRAKCRKCQVVVPGSQIEESLKKGEVARCKACPRPTGQPAVGMKRKKSYNGKTSKKRRAEFEDSSDDDGEYDIAEPGVMKPEITMFGEDLPQNFHSRIVAHDQHLVDLCIVIGTSLKVSPVANIPDFLPLHVPQINISREPVHHIQFDIELLGDCDEIVTDLCRRAGWKLQHEMIKEGGILREAKYDEQDWRWHMVPPAGGIIEAKAMDEGTLGHGRSLSPTAERRPGLNVGRQP